MKQGEGEGDGKEVEIAKLAAHGDGELNEQYHHKGRLGGVRQRQATDKGGQLKRQRNEGADLVRDQWQGVKVRREPRRQRLSLVVHGHCRERAPLLISRGELRCAGGTVQA
uniref:Uncharacterized protein n=1 Tax=Ditylum brightwellii TaxID=49249 RepID=A0A6U3RQK6_9STRA|mmetsp:Transcript_2812/g.4312  ORF Transcript_2812/g.4312 Transcript_2812/m.4312 type:complete len:111 (+) Transcript_2812:197-529(+)